MRFAKKSWLLAPLVLIGFQQDSSGQDRFVGDGLHNSRLAAANSALSQSTLTNSPAPELPKPLPSQESLASGPGPLRTRSSSLPKPSAQQSGNQQLSAQQLGAQRLSAQQPSNQQPSNQRPAPSPGCFFLNTRSFTIPFTVDAAGAKPREVQLFTSRGASSPWKLVAAKPATAPSRAFQFTGSDDGEFWFATRTIDSQGRAYPTGPIQPQLKVFVDTRKPEIVLEAEADASGRIDLKVVINDASPLRLELRYFTDTVKKWQEVAVAQLPSDGKLHFKPNDSWEQLSLQFVATDSGKNRSVVSKLVSRPRLAETPNSRLAATGSDQGGDIRSAQFRSAHRPSPPSPAASDPSPAASDPSPAASDPSPEAGDPLIRLAQNPHIPGTRAPGAHGPGVISGPVYGDPSRSGYTGNPGGGYPGYPGFGYQSGLNGFRGAAPPSATPPLSSPAGPPFGDSAAGGGATYGQRILPATTPEALPQPATPMQISHGFGPPSTYTSNRILGIPTGAAASEAVPSPSGEAAEGGSIGLNGPQQSTPMPETKSASPGVAAPSVARPRTPGEALRPLSSTRLVPDEIQGKVETIPAPTPQIDTGAAKQTARRPVEIDITSGRVPVRYSDSVRFSLEFEVEAVGSAGVESIELYGSTDGGQTWKFWGEDPDRISPFDIETKEEGMFGFRIVVVGRNGLTSPRPLPGETPDIVVVVDQVKPMVRISAAKYGEGDRLGSLVIGYECEDANLMQRPISLSFSDAVDGPWTTIAAGLRNDGSYVWPADPGLPRKLYLRIDAKDQAGNVGTYILDRPIDAQGLAPRARIRGFTPLSAADDSSSGTQTAARPQRQRK